MDVTEAEVFTGGILALTLCPQLCSSVCHGERVQGCAESLLGCDPRSAHAFVANA